MVWDIARPVPAIASLTIDCRASATTAPASLRTTARMAGIMPAGAETAATETPVVRLFREWKAADAAMAAIDAEMKDADHEEGSAWDQAWEARWATEQRLMAESCVDCRDWMFKIVAWTNFGDGSSCDRHECPQLWAEAHALVGGAA